MKSTSWLLALALLLGCPPANDDDSGVEPPAQDDDDDDSTPVDVLDPVWSELHPELNYRCACHRTSEGSEGDLGGMEDADLIYARLVGAPSHDLPDMNRVEPGQPARSYLWLKVNDAHLAAGGRGDRMPPTGPGLSDELKGVILAWIELGAVQDES